MSHCRLRTERGRPLSGFAAWLVDGADQRNGAAPWCQSPAKPAQLK